MSSSYLYHHRNWPDVYKTGRLNQEDPTFRAVVFSQFTSFLDLIQAILRREKYDYYRFDGTMDVKKRSDTVSAFKKPSKQPKVLIISLQAGGVGLNVRLLVFTVKHDLKICFS